MFLLIFLSCQNHCPKTQSEAPATPSRGVRCQLLNWNSVDDVVVGEGEFCSIEPTYKIGRIPLGPNAAAVVVKSVSNAEAYVWWPTPTIILLGDAMEEKIAWPADKLILDNDSPTPNKTACSEVIS